MNPKLRHGVMSDTERDLDLQLTEFATFLTDLHASEINGEISWFYDNVWGWAVVSRRGSARNAAGKTLLQSPDLSTGSRPLG